MSDAGLPGYRISPQQQRLFDTGLEAARWRCVLDVTPDAAAGTGPLDGRLRALVARHEILRTAFERVPGLAQPVQVVQAAGLPGADPPRVSAAPGPDGHRRLTLDAGALHADGPTLLLLARELLGGSGPEPVQYADLAEWQWQLLEADSTAPGRERYAARRRAQPAGTALGFAAAAGGTGAAADQVEVAVTLDAAAAAPGPRAAATLLAAWWALLGRVTGAGDVTTAVLADGRALAELASSPGPLAKHLPVSAAAVPDLGLGALTERAERELADAADAHPYHDPRTGTPPTAFSYADARPAPGSEVVSLVADPERFAVKLCVLAGDRLRVTLRAGAAALPRATVEHLAVLYRRLLAAGLDDPGRPTGALPLAARATQAARHGGARASARARALVHERALAHAAARPDGVAVVCGGDRLTWGELAARSAALAGRLRALGVGTDDRVGLAFDRSVESVVALLAVLRAGAAFVPLDQHLPAARLRRMRALAGVDIVVDRSWLGGPAAPAGGDAAVPGEALAYVLFTSGSGGEPKAVGVEHRQVSAYVAALGRRLGDAAGLSWATVSSLGTDLGHTAVLAALVGGGTLHVVGEPVATDPAALGALMAREAVDGLKIAPSHLDALLATRPDAALLPRTHLVLGGERLPPGLVDRVRALAPACTVWNHYGPTETTIGCTMQRVAPAATAPHVPLGRPLDHATVHVLDRSGQPVPPLVTGELCVGGAGVARGYAGRARETAERFVPDPFAPAPGARMYRTGDLGWFEPDGSISFARRRDRQVKIRGFRVEPGEVEAVLAAAPGAAGAVVVCDEAAQRLAAYVVGPGDGARPDVAALHEHVAARLPEHMVPASITVVGAFPLTAAGKVDRPALAALETSPARGAVTPPSTEREADLVGLWEALLGVAPIGVDDDFFELGGHSLTAMRLVARLQERDGAEVGLAAVLEARTVRRLAALLDQAAVPGSAG